MKARPDMERDRRSDAEAMNSGSLEARYRAILEAMPVTVNIIDLDYNIIEVSLSLLETLGVKNNDVAGNKCYAVFRNRRSPCPECSIPEVIRTGRPVSRATSYSEKEVSGIASTIHAVPVTDDDGNVTEIVEFLVDPAIMFEEKLYRNIFENMVEVYVRSDYRGFLKLVSPSAARMFGFDSPEEALGMHIVRDFLVDPEEKTAFLRALQKDSVRDYPVRLRKKDGSVFDAEVSFRHYADDSGSLSGMEGFIRDVSDKLIAQRELLEEREWQNAIFDALPVGVIVLEEGSHEIVLVNPAAEKMTGYSAEEMTGKLLPAGLFAGEFAEIIDGDRERYLLHDATLTDRDGDELPVQFNGVALRQNGDRIGAAAFVQDLRKIRQLEKEKIDAERLAAVGQTVAGLAHGIKNILTGLEGGMYVFRGGLEKNDQTRIDRGWEMLERNIDRITLLARSLLSFSKGDPPVVSTIDPVALAREVVDLFDDAARKANVVLELDVPDTIEAAPMDREGMHSCLANLVSNAIDACQMGDKPDCKVTVRCSETAGGGGEGGTLLFEVADEGCGMNYEIKKKVFTNFFTTKGAVGTGIGLLLTRKIVQEHGGTITFESAPEKGTLFRLLFRRDRLPVPSDK